jgi:uncharacterized protein (UPF0335 family)
MSEAKKVSAEEILSRLLERVRHIEQEAARIASVMERMIASLQSRANPTGSNAP